MRFRACLLSTRISHSARASRISGTCVTPVYPHVSWLLRPTQALAGSRPPPPPDTLLATRCSPHRILLLLPVPLALRLPFDSKRLAADLFVYSIDSRRASAQRPAILLSPIAIRPKYPRPHCSPPPLVAKAYFKTSELVSAFAHRYEHFTALAEYFCTRNSSAPSTRTSLVAMNVLHPVYKLIHKYSID